MHTVILFVTFIPAAILHGISGIGFPIIITSALALFMPIKDAVVFALFPTFLVNLFSVLIGRQVGLVLKKYSLLALFSLLGSLIGAKILLIVNHSYLQLFLSIIIVFYIFNTIHSNRLHLSNNLVISSLFGLIAGVLGGSINAMSPVLIMYLLAIGDDHNEITRAANLCFLISKIGQLIILHDEVYQIILSKGFSTLLILSALSLVSLFIGIYIRKKLNTKYFRLIALFLLSCLAIISITQASYALLKI